jgi:hypothetical protein
MMCARTKFTRIMFEVENAQKSIVELVDKAREREIISVKINRSKFLPVALFTILKSINFNSS